MIHHIKRMFRKLSPVEIASAELVEAQVSLLEAHTGHEYAQAMVNYNKQRVDRLRKQISLLAKDAP